MAKRAAGPAYHRYAEDVAAGKLVACKWVRFACERYLRDLEAHGTKPGGPFCFDPAAAQHRLDFNNFLHHWKGKWAGQLFRAEPWQQFCQANLFGWKRADGTRRFRKAYTTVARKNGKTFDAGGTGLYMLVADGEQGAEIYSAATKKDQARIVWDDAKQMVKRSPSLAKRVQTLKINLSVQATASKFEPLSAEDDTLDGLNPHGVVIDELHAHKTRGVLDVLDTATGARSQPLLYMITTAGADRHSPCRFEQNYAEQVLSGTVENDAYFAYIATLDEGDDWKDERNWAKANPNLGVSVQIEELREQAKEAADKPAALNSFLRLRLNMWTEQETRWIALERWDKCGGVVDRAALRGRACFAGLDLSSTTDLTALVLRVPAVEEGERHAILPFYWLPEDNLAQRVKRDRVPYDAWKSMGYLETTPGASIDYAWIIKRLQELADEFVIQEVAYDRWGAQKIRTDLEDLGFAMVEFGQGMASMSPAMKQLEGEIMAGQINHGDHPILRWNFDNLAPRMDPAGNIKPDKERSREKIDGLVALIMATGRASVAPALPKSVYETRGILTFGGTA